MTRRIGQAARWLAAAESSRWKMGRCSEGKPRGGAASGSSDVRESSGGESNGGFGDAEPVGAAWSEANMFGVGPWELVVVLLVVTLLFGKRIPDIARSVGRSILEFKRGTEGSTTIPLRLPTRIRRAEGPRPPVWIAFRDPGPTRV